MKWITASGREKTGMSCSRPLYGAVSMSNEASPRRPEVN